MKLEEGNKSLSLVNVDKEVMRDTIMGKQLQINGASAKAELPKIILVKTRMTT